MNPSHHLKLTVIAAILLGGVAALLLLLHQTVPLPEPNPPTIHGSFAPIPDLPTSPADRADLLQRAALDPHHTDLRARFARALADAHPSEFPDLAALLNTLPRDLAPAPLWRELLRAWAHHDGPTAFALNHEIAIAGAVDAIAARDAAHPGQPAQTLADLPDLDQRQFQTTYLAGAWLRRDPALVMGLATSLPDPAMRQSAVHHVARTIASHPAHPDPAAAARWLASLTDDPATHRATAWLAGAWAASDPKTAAAWAESLPPGPARAAAFHELIGSWAGADPDNAGTWLASRVGPPEFDRAIAEYARIAIGQDPEVAQSWISQITEPQWRDSLEAELAERIGTTTQHSSPTPP